MIELPRLISEALKVEGQIMKLAPEIAKARDILYLGRGQHYPIALEGALKLRESPTSTRRATPRENSSTDPSR
jgi:glucosamine--fructose-6-phosphate aminotransferase (isomerizing)